MKQPLIDYLSSIVIEDIRQHRWFDETVADTLDAYPLIDSLRALVQQDDVPTLMEMAESQNTHNRNLAIGLLRRFDTQANVKAFFLKEWHRSIDDEYRYILMWRILDDEYLDVSIHEDIFKFVNGNMEMLIRNCHKWYGGANFVLDGVRKRLSDPSFPRTKDWVYLCVALVSTERDSVVELIANYESSKDEFVATVAKDLSQRLRAM